MAGSIRITRFNTSYHDLKQLFIRLLEVPVSTKKLPCPKQINRHYKKSDKLEMRVSQGATINYGDRKQIECNQFLCICFPHSEEISAFRKADGCRNTQ